MRNCRNPCWILSQSNKQTTSLFVYCNFFLSQSESTSSTQMRTTYKIPNPQWSSHVWGRPAAILCPDCLCESLNAAPAAGPALTRWLARVLCDPFRLVDETDYSSGEESSRSSAGVFGLRSDHMQGCIEVEVEVRLKFYFFS